MLPDEYECEYEVFNSEYECTAGLAYAQEVSIPMEHSVQCECEYECENGVFRLSLCFECAAMQALAQEAYAQEVSVPVEHSVQVPIQRVVGGAHAMPLSSRPLSPFPSLPMGGHKMVSPTLTHAAAPVHMRALPACAATA